MLERFLRLKVVCADEPAVLIGHGNDWSQPEADGWQPFPIKNIWRLPDAFSEKVPPFKHPSGITVEY